MEGYQVFGKVIEKHYDNLYPDVYRLLMEHPVSGIPRIYSVTQDENGWTTTEQYIPGRTLDSALKAGLFTGRYAANVCSRLCGILEGLHEIGIVHGDLKPENIIFGDDGNLYLIDFNASHFVKNESGTDTILLGTPGYAAPEQYGFGRSDARADIYSVGVLLNVMVTGWFPVYKMADGRIANVIKRCTEMDPDERYQNIKELKDGLRYKSRRREFLPVGFRSGNPAKMIAASLIYALIIFVFGFGIRSGHYSGTDSYFDLYYLPYRLLMIFWLIGGIFIFFDYGGINGLFTKKTGIVRVIVKIAQFIIYTIILVVLMYLLHRLILTAPLY